MRFGLELEMAALTKSYLVQNGQAFQLFIAKKIESLASNASERWVLENDNSCGNEFISPILNYENGGLKSLKFLCDIIKGATTKMRENFNNDDIRIIGKDCGIHFHFEVSKEQKHPFKQIRNAMLMAVMLEPMFYAMNPPSRLATKFSGPLNVNLKQLIRARDLTDLRDLWFRNYMGVNGLQDSHRNVCNVYPIEFINQNLAPVKYDWTRYHGFNLVSFFKHGTLEWRYTHGTFNYNVIEKWFHIYRLIMQTAFDKPTNQIMHRDIVPVPKGKILADGRCNQLHQMLNKNLSQVIKYFINCCNPPIEIVKFIVERITKFHGHSNNMGEIYNEVRKATSIDEIISILNKRPIVPTKQYQVMWGQLDKDMEAIAEGLFGGGAPGIQPVPAFFTNGNGAN